ncbi:hypothetical protein QC761_509920 [Podospora bellae-mahoneyi]|uniref:Fungal N-terminal domain-containing protein n=1 Tax=Podospora bellae-mahoneyi TaxID=2093777 RepID=A0ABR0FHH1_9PEZI|nr:hypothetical protein QC761_509920 [Podospora bellae-mahoneyi]
MADPLSITASIVGIVAAASKVLSLLGDITDAPRSIADLLNEVYDLRLIFCNLQSFIDRTRQFDPSRLALIQLGDLVAILTRTVIAFSKLESIVRPLCDREKLSTWQLLSWRWQQTAALRVLTQLQRHKISLSLMLQIYQCVTDLEARQKAGALRDHLEQELDDNQGLADRLAGMKLSPELEEMSTAVFDMNDASSALQTPGDRQDPTTADLELAKTGAINTDLPLNTPPDQASTNESEDDDDMTDSEFQLSRAFEVVLFRTWVYRRNEREIVDGVSTINTTRSQAWSILSGITLSKMSTLSIVNLPLTQPEVERFTSLASRSLELRKPVPPTRPSRVDIAIDPRLVKELEAFPKRSPAFCEIIPPRGYWRGYLDATIVGPTVPTLGVCSSSACASRSITL